MEENFEEIQINNISANSEQPRENFDKEAIQELAESILSNGLINPIKVRPIKKDKYIIVAGERRWRASKAAGLKTIKAFVKQYKDDEWMVESFIENIHREDLSPTEKGKYCLKLMKIKGIKDIGQLSKEVSARRESVLDWIDDYKLKQKGVISEDTSHTLIRATRGLDEDERKDIIKFAKNKEIPARQIEEKIIPVIKASPKEVKEALFTDTINVQQAESISKLKDKEKRVHAINEFKALKVVEKNIVKNSKNRDTAKEKRELQKQLEKAETWIKGFKSENVAVLRQLEKAIKVLLMAVGHIPIMDDKQRERLLDELELFIEKCERGKQLAEQIKEKIEK